MIRRLLCLFRGHRFTDRKDISTLPDGTGYLRLYGQCSRCGDMGLYTGRTKEKEV